mmetsp:Transcript_89489/g.253569  ORF Transcript_89489/g.253569 Transcript_89489/m.253569 type:complete len:223 (+) Transcript_89489:676-1344(+)
MVVQAHAVVDPLAVVIHAHHTDVADLAVVCALGPGYATALAVGGLPEAPQRLRIEDRQGVADALDERLPLHRHVPGVGLARLVVAQHRQAPGDVEHQKEQRDEPRPAQLRQDAAQEEDVVADAGVEQDRDAGEGTRPRTTRLPLAVALLRRLVVVAVHHGGHVGLRILCRGAILNVPGPHADVPVRALLGVLIAPLADEGEHLPSARRLLRRATSSGAATST